MLLLCCPSSGDLGNTGLGAGLEEQEKTTGGSIKGGRLDGDVALGIAGSADGAAADTPKSDTAMGTDAKDDGMGKLGDNGPKNLFDGADYAVSNMDDTSIAGGALGADGGGVQAHSSQGEKHDDNLFGQDGVEDWQPHKQRSAGRGGRSGGRHGGAGARVNRGWAPPSAVSPLQQAGSPTAHTGKA